MCAIFSVFGSENAAELAYVGLHWQQHRAVEYAGMVTSDGSNLYRQAGRGLVPHVFSQGRLDELRGSIALGHLRYSTVEGDPAKDNTQPIVMPNGDQAIAVAHNGNLTNVEELRGGLPPGIAMQTSIDTELILQRFCLATGSTVTERIVEALDGVRGSYSLVFLLPDRLIAVRDRFGNRPLSLGKRDGSYFLASETCAFDAVQAETIRDVRPGEILTISKDGLTSELLPGPYPDHQAMCVFELIYFALPSSNLFGKQVADFRFQLGKRLEELHPVPGADVVVGVPDSALPVAAGYADSGRSGIDVRALLRHHIVPRTFIQPEQTLRNLFVARKFAVVSEGERGVKGRVVVLVDDSIVRLTTMPQLVQALRWAGARQVHVRIGCPPIRHPCLYGIDTPTEPELAAATLTREQMLKKTGADSLEFLSMEALRELTGNHHNFCFACMTGEYPI